MTGRRRQSQAKTPQPCTIASANVRRAHAAHITLLHLAYKQDIDLILVQEPWIGQEADRRVTKQHPACHAVTSMPDWATRPRIMTYVRKDRLGCGLT